MSAFLQHVTDMTGQEAAIVDCSISREMASLYHSLLSTGFHVVTSNVSSLLASGPQLHGTYFPEPEVSLILGNT